MDEQRAVRVWWHWVGERHTKDKRKEKRVRKRSMVICPAHRAQFLYLHPNAREYGEYFDLTECEYCKRERNASQLIDYTDAELKDKVEQLVPKIQNHFMIRTNYVAREWNVIRALMRDFGRVKDRPVNKFAGMRKVKPWKVDTFVSEWLEQNKFERNVLSQAYEKGILDTLYGRARTFYIMDELSERIIPAKNRFVVQRIQKKNKRSGKIDA